MNASKRSCYENRHNWYIAIEAIVMGIEGAMHWMKTVMKIAHQYNAIEAIVTGFKGAMRCMKTVKKSNRWFLPLIKGEVRWGLENSGKHPTPL